MTGDKEGDMRGIIPRSVEQIIEQVMLMRADGWEVVVTTSMVIFLHFIHIFVCTFFYVFFYAIMVHA